MKTQRKLTAIVLGMVWAMLFTAQALAQPGYKEPLDARTLNAIKAEFGKLMELANRHDFNALHGILVPFGVLPLLPRPTSWPTRR